MSQYASPYNGIGNNPVNLIDRWGMCAGGIEGGGGGGYSGMPSWCDGYGGSWSNMPSYCYYGYATDYLGMPGDVWAMATSQSANVSVRRYSTYTEWHTCNPDGSNDRVTGYSEPRISYEIDWNSVSNTTIYKNGNAVYSTTSKFSGKVEAKDNSKGGLTASEQMELGLRYYGGDYSGSISDWVFFIADQLNQINPLTIGWDYLTYLGNGTDRFGNPMSCFEATLSVSFIFLGEFKIEAREFHRAIKPSILNAAGDFSSVVGRNPDIAIKNGQIILNGTGPYKGKTYKTGLNLLDFLE